MSPNISDPPTVERAPSSKNMVQMLIDGELDAAVVGDKLPDPRLEVLIPDFEQAARAWAEKHGAPINHMAVIRTELSRTRPDIVRETFRMLKESRDVGARNGDKNSAQTSIRNRSKPGCARNDHRYRGAPEAHSPEMAGRGAVRRRDTRSCLRARRRRGRCHEASMSRMPSLMKSLERLLTRGREFDILRCGSGWREVGCDSIC